MKADTFDPRVDAYINRSAPFAQPILAHIRELVHKAVPGIEESIKWSMPFFTYKGQMFGNIAAFKEHCSFGLFGGTMKEACPRLPSDGSTEATTTWTSAIPPLVTHVLVPFSTHSSVAWS